MPNDNLPTSSGFEGPEKLLEIWFSKPSADYIQQIKLNGLDSMTLQDSVATLDPSAPSASATKKEGLRLVDRSVWEEMLNIVQCRVLSTLHNEYADAYLLSESSMFVHSYRLTLKTCGTTTLLHSIEKILEIAREHCQLDKIEAVFYSRKAFLFPEQQTFPHGSWSDEINYLDLAFPKNEYDTAGYVIGKVNGDHWCLYLATPLQEAKKRDVHIQNDQDDDDITLEILMQDLDQDAMKEFWRTNEEVTESRLPHNIKLQKHILKDPKRIYNNTGLAKIYPESIVDDYAFDPCGYSANGLLGPYYYTIHVTPESQCSYASFETTIPVKSFQHVSKSGIAEYDSFNEVVEKVINVFKPGKFSTTLFMRRSMSDHFQKSLAETSPRGFRHRDRIIHSLGGWELVFSHYEKN